MTARPSPKQAWRVHLEVKLSNGFNKSCPEPGQ